MRDEKLGRPVAFTGGWQARGELADGVARLTVDMLAAEAAMETRERRRRPVDAVVFARAIEAIACNLALINAVAPGRALAIQRSKKARENCTDFGAPFNAAADLMARMGLVTQRIGYKGTATTLTPTESVLVYLPAALSPSHLASMDAPAVLEVRPTKAEWRETRKLCPVPNTPEAAQLRAEMLEVREWLGGSSVEFDGPQFWLREPKGRLARMVTLHGGALRRVFNNGSLEHGGRIFDGWWQSLPAAERLARIRIAGERVVELDFRAMVPRLCYALLGVPWRFGADDCPYTARPGGDRAAWKTLTNAMLASCAPLRSWPGETIADQNSLRDALAMPLSEAATAVRLHHAAFTRAGGFGQRLSTRAMRIESDIAVRVVLALRARGCVVLPNHDGFIAPASKAGTVSAVMREAAMARAGVDLVVTAKD